MSIPSTHPGSTSGTPTLPAPPAYAPNAPPNPRSQHPLRPGATPFWPRAADFLQEEEEDEEPHEYMERRALYEEEDSGTDEEVQLLGMYHRRVEQDHTITRHVHHGHQYLEDQVHRWSTDNPLLPNADHHLVGRRLMQRHQEGHAGKRSCLSGFSALIHGHGPFP